MKARMTLPLILVVGLILANGCGGFSSQTQVNLKNDTNFPVVVQLYYDDDQLLPEFLFETDGTELTATVQSGNTFTFSRSCEDLQAIYIKEAEMQVAPGISPDEDTRVYREPSDFGCGDTLTFTFTQNALATEIDIAYAQQN